MLYGSVYSGYDASPLGAQQVMLPSERRAISQRVYHIACRDQAGFVQEQEKLGVATFLFESACMALARGAVVQTRQGPRAIEDICPGMEVLCEGDAWHPVRWIGSSLWTPQVTEGGPPPGSQRLYRVEEAAFGYEKPWQNIIFGPGAHVRSREVSGQPDRFVKADSMVNGETVFGIAPSTAFPMFHLAFDTHQVVMVNGLGVSSYHPGLIAGKGLEAYAAAELLKLFPYLHRIEDFGPLQGMTRVCG